MGKGRTGLVRKQIALGPDYAVYRLTRSTPDGTDWKGLGRLFGVAIVTLC